MVVTKRRVYRAICARLSRFSLRIANLLISDKQLYCNSCGRKTVGFWSFEGRPFGCPWCLASSRERFVIAELSAKRLSIPDGARIMHVAPSEKSIRGEFSAKAKKYICVDIEPSNYRDMDVMALDLTTLASREDLGQFDVIYASHVLEHIPDLDAALLGIRSRLTNTGEAWFLFPIGSGPTQEDPELRDPHEREIRFGQWDHIRLFGDDSKDIIERCGFDVHVLEVQSLSVRDVDRLGLDPLDRIFVCTPHLSN